MEFEDIFPRSQEPATGPYPLLGQSNLIPTLTLYFSKIRFNIILSWSLFPFGF